MTSNFRDWHAVVRQIPRHRVLETSMDHQSKLVQDPLRDVQPVQLSMQYRCDSPRSYFLVPVTIRAAAFRTRCSLLVTLFGAPTRIIYVTIEQWYNHSDAVEMGPG